MATIPGLIQAKGSIRPSPTNHVSNITLYIAAQWTANGPVVGSQFYVLTQGPGVQNFYVKGAVTQVECVAPYREAVVVGTATVNGVQTTVTMYINMGAGLFTPTQ